MSENPYETITYGEYFIQIGDYDTENLDGFMWI